MNTKATVRILNLDHIIPGWRDFSAGFYTPPTNNSADMLVLGVDLAEFHFADEEKEVLSYFSRFMDHGGVHIFILCRQYKYLNTRPNAGMQDSECDLCIRKLAPLAPSDLRYTGTILYDEGYHFHHDTFRNALLFTRMLHDWGAGIDPCASVPDYTVLAARECKALSRGYMHFHFPRS